MAKFLYPRHVEPRLTEALEDSPVVLIQGPRQCGKTTLARMVGKPAGYDYISFDDQVVWQAAKHDPVGFVNDLPERVIVDEVQRVPELFSAIKLSVDSNRIAGRFILTGSVSVLHVRRITDSLAGRMRIINLYPFSQCEIERTKPVFLDHLFAGNFKFRQRAVEKNGLIDRIVKGGYPDALRYSSEPKRTAWYRDYIEALIRHDVPDIAGIRSLDTLSKLLSLAAAQTAQLFNTSNLSKSFQLSRLTIHDYLTILETTFMITRLAAWHGNRARRLVKTPKLHLTDTGVACSLTGMSKSTLADDRDRLGRLLETFVVQELQRQASGHEWRHSFSHYRNKDGAEVDLVIERDAATLAGVEVKSAATVKQTDFRGLRLLKNATGERFKSGVIVYTGDRILPFGDNLYAVPLEFLWMQI